MSMVETIEHEGEVLAIVIRGDFAEPGVSFLTPADFTQQLAFMKHERGTKIQPHVHNRIRREVFYSREVLIIRKGSLRADLYADDRALVASVVLHGGDVILLASGGHGFEALDDVEMFEVKQGPYVGEGDKTRFPPKEK